MTATTLLRVELSPDVLMRELEGESVLLDMKSQRYYGLDEVGTRIWQLLGELRSPGAVVEAMLAEFDVERPQLERDLELFLSRLEAAALVTLVGPRPASEEPAGRAAQDP